MVYRITEYSYKKADLLGVDIKPSNRKNKKIDVYKDGKKIASIGDVNYSDFPSYMKSHGVEYASDRRRAYKKRHEKDRHKKGSAGFFSDQILW